MKRSKTVNQVKLTKRILTLMLAAGLSLTLFAGCTQPQQAPVPVIDEGTGAVTKAVPTITVNGTGELTLTPDKATIELGVEVSARATAKEAIADNAQAMEAVAAALTGFGIESKDIQTSNFSLYANYEYDANGNRADKPTYTVSNMLSVTVYDIDNLGAIIDGAVEAGANTSYGINFDVSDRLEKETEALVLALENARARADALAKASGKQVGEVLLLNDGTEISEAVYYQNVPRAEAAMDSASAYKTSISTGSMKVTAKVSVRFTLV